MLFTNRAYTKHQDIHDHESFRKSGFLYSALQSPIQYCVFTASDIEISSLLNRNPLKSLSPSFFSIFDEKLSHPWIQNRIKGLNFLRLSMGFDHKKTKIIQKKSQRIS